MVVDVHDEGFACTGCHPESELFKIFCFKASIWNIAGGSRVVSALDEIVELV